MMITIHVTVSSSSQLPHGHRQQSHLFNVLIMEERVISLTQKTRLVKSLPTAIKSCIEDGGWQIVLHRNTSSCTIMTEKEFLNEYARNGLCQTYKEIESNLSSHLNRFGLDHDDPNTFMSLELYEVIAIFLI